MCGSFAISQKRQFGAIWQVFGCQEQIQKKVHLDNLHHPRICCTCTKAGNFLFYRGHQPKANGKQEGEKISRSKTTSDKWDARQNLSVCDRKRGLHQLLSANIGRASMSIWSEKGILYTCCMQICLLQFPLFSLLPIAVSDNIFCMKMKLFILLFSKKYTVSVCVCASFYWCDKSTATDTKST